MSTRIFYSTFIHPLVYIQISTPQKGYNFSSCTRSTADCRHVSLTPLHPNSCSRCRVSTLHTHAIGATAGDLPAQLHASYTANAKWQLAGPSLLARNYKQTLVRMGIIDQRRGGWPVDFYRRGMMRDIRLNREISGDFFPDTCFLFTVEMFLISPRRLFGKNNSLLDLSRFKWSILFCFFLFFF